MEVKIFSSVMRNWFYLNAHVPKMVGTWVFIPPIIICKPFRNLLNY